MVITGHNLGESLIHMENREQFLTDHSTAYDHSSDDFRSYLKSGRIKEMIDKNEVIIALELAIVMLFAGLAWLLITNI